MDMAEIKGGSITLRLDPADAFLLARACDAAAFANEGSTPKRDHFAGLGMPEYALAPLYFAVAAMFEAAGCCAFNQDEIPSAHHEELALTAIRSKVRAVGPIATSKGGAA